MNKKYIGGEFELNIKLHRGNKYQDFEIYFGLKDNHAGEKYTIIRSTH